MLSTMLSVGAGGVRMVRSFILKIRRSFEFFALTKAGRILVLTLGLLALFVVGVLFTQKKNHSPSALNPLATGEAAHALFPKLTPQSIDAIYLRDLTKGQELHFRREEPLASVQWVLQGKLSTPEWRVKAWGPMGRPEPFVDLRVNQNYLKHFVEILTMTDFIVSTLPGSFESEQELFAKYPSLAKPNPEIELYWSVRDRGAETRGIEVLRFDANDPTLGYIANRLLPVRFSGGLPQFLGVERGIDLGAFVQKTLDRSVTNFHTDDLDEIIIQAGCFNGGAKQNKTLGDFYARRGGSIWEVYDHSQKTFARLQIPTAAMDEALDGLTQIQYDGFLMQSSNYPQASELQELFQSSESEKTLDAFCRISLKGRLETKEVLRIFKKTSDDKTAEDQPYVAKLEGRSDNLNFYISQNKLHTILQSLESLWKDSRRSPVAKAASPHSVAAKPAGPKQ